MDRLEQIKNELAREYRMKNFTSLLRSIHPSRMTSIINEIARRYATEMVRHNLERAAGQAAIEAESRLSGKTIHSSINSEDPQWVARVNRESITSIDIELI